MDRLSRIRYFLFGKPIASRFSHHEKVSVPVGLAVFASDALSSVAYATEEILLVLVGASISLAYFTVFPIALALAVLMIIVGASYYQTIKAYPKGGGTYLVTTENLGSKAGRVAAGALLIDYVLTVAVSISSGTAALVSLVPAVQPYTVGIGCFAVGVLCLLNLRGAKESGLVFALPTYLFVVSVFVLIIASLVKGLNSPQVAPTLPDKATADFGLFLILRGFAASCTALTGTEAIADGVQAFKEPASVNARRTLVMMVTILITMFLGITWSAMHFGITPLAAEDAGYRTVLAQLAVTAFGGEGFMYQVLLISTAMILFLAANTAYADFPRLCSFVAKDGYLPRQLLSLGDRLVYQNGILLLSVFAGFLLVVYKADTHSLIPLYALGVFVSFTLSQSGMAAKQIRDKRNESSGQKWLTPPALLSLFGALVTAGVAVILLVTKFSEGAWIIAVAISVLLLLFRFVHAHYEKLAKVLQVQEGDNLPPMETVTLMLIPRVHRGILHAIQYARLSSPDTRALHVSLDQNQAQRMKADWNEFGVEMPLVILDSPYRSLTDPVIQYVDSMLEMNKKLVVTVIVPQAVVRNPWTQWLHNNAAVGLKLALSRKERVVITNVRYFVD